VWFIFGQPSLSRLQYESTICRPLPTWHLLLVVLRGAQKPCVETLGLRGPHNYPLLPLSLSLFLSVSVSRSVSVLSPFRSPEKVFPTPLTPANRIKQASTHTRLLISKKMSSHFVGPNYVPGLGVVDPFAVYTSSWKSMSNALLATALFRCWHILIFYACWATAISVISHNVYNLGIQPTLLTV
jgi:hypothetical protein